MHSTSYAISQPTMSYTKNWILVHETTTYIGKTVNTLYERFHASGSGHLHTNNVDSTLLNHTNKSEDLCTVKSGDLCTVHLMRYHNLYQELQLWYKYSTKSCLRMLLGYCLFAIVSIRLICRTCKTTFW